MTCVSFPSCPCSDPSQNDPNCKDFWFNMQALSVHLQREAELNPQASYYNVGVLKYQVSVREGKPRASVMTRGAFIYLWRASDHVICSSCNTSALPSTSTVSDIPLP